MLERKFPIGIQTFSEIIRGKYIYIDKTDLVWNLAHYSKFVFLSRPRRFGKSLLASTLESYFLGNKEIFQGLKILDLEKDWTCYPTFRFDLSGAKHMPVQGVKDELNLLLAPYEKIFGRNPEEVTPGMRLAGIIDRAYEQTGKQVAVIIDEYDAPLLDVLHDDQRLHDIRELMQEFYQRLKKQEGKIKFCFITGITKFSQLSIFSTINNLTNITMQPEFSTLCGITDEELTTVLTPYIEQFAACNQLTTEEMHKKLKLQYDGYHFSEDSPGVYNPFSLLKALQQCKLYNYWFESGTPTFLIRQLKYFNTNITEMDNLEVPASAFDQPTENMKNALPLLYQSGYLSIKDYNRESMLYTLSIPNQEVRVGFTDGLLPAYTGLLGSDVQAGFAAKFWLALKRKDINSAMCEMQSYMARIPYIEGFKRKLSDAATAEGFYEYTLYLIFSMLNVYVQTQVKCAGGRIDMVVEMSDTVYVFELKTNGTVKEALLQIDNRSYAIPYQTSNKAIIKVGVLFDKKTRTVKEWAVA